MEVTCRAWGDIGVTRQEEHRQSFPMGRAGEKEQSTAVPMVSVPPAPAMLQAHPSIPIHPSIPCTAPSPQTLPPAIQPLSGSLSILSHTGPVTG